MGLEGRNLPRHDRAGHAELMAIREAAMKRGDWRLNDCTLVVTLEPLPSRIASIAMGTGDIDCTYHAALDELLAAAQADERSHDQLDMLRMLIDGRRLRDISDLPLDLAT